MHSDDLSKTQILRNIHKKATDNALPGLSLSEGGHRLDVRGLPLIGVVEIELRDENERKNFLRQVQHAADVFKTVAHK